MACVASMALSYSIKYGAVKVETATGGSFGLSETTTFKIPGNETFTIPCSCDTDTDCAPPSPFVCPLSTCNVATSTCEQNCNCDYTCDANESAATCRPSGCTTSSSLTTTKTAGNQQAGNMFKIAVQQSKLQILGFKIHTTGAGSYNAKVYHKASDFVGSENKIGDWTLLQEANGVESQGEGTLTPLPPLSSGPILLEAGSTHSFYVTLTTPYMKYTNGNSFGAMYAENEDMQFFQGNGKSYPFGGTFSPRIWNGEIIYVCCSSLS